MLSAKYNQATSSNDRAAPLKSKIHKLTRVAKSHAEMSARASDDDDDGTSAHSKNNAASQRRSTTELDQWHKLMGDYERLQLVASTKAHNKLIRSSSESSLGSSSNLSQASTVVASSNSSSAANNTTNQRPTSMIARLSSAARATANTRRQTSDEQETRENYAHESEIGQCLSELVESVVAAAVATRATSERAQVTYEQERERERPQPFRSFKLHEAILAKTQSSSSDNASSCDEATAQDKPGPCERKRVVRVNALGEFALGEQEAHDREHVIYAAREFACAHPAGDQLTVGSSDSTIKWLDANNNENQLGMGQILGCQQDDELIVWLLHVGTQDVASPTSDVGLDLDDIAMALNEPVSSKQQQIRAIIWSCANSADARQLVDFWVNHTQNVAHKQQENHQIEVKPCEVAAAEQMKSSGLFVLQQQPPVECTESRGQTTKQPTEVVRLAKAASTLDLATSGSSSSLARQPALRRPTEGANLLANYYRSVTNKMMGGTGHSNGSTSGRLKNFTQEMSKLNGRGQTTLAKSARRLSMALNQFSHSTSSSSTSGAAQLQQTQTKSSTATDDVALPPPPPAVKPRTSVLKSSLAPEQRALPRSILKRQCTSGSDERVDGSGDKSSRVEQLERVKQRASCHDLAKVLGPNDMASDKDKPTLRANWTNSVASRSRQRRPALLLNDQVEASANTESSAVAESGAGMVRAKSSMSHLRRSASMKVLAVASSDAREEKLVDDDQREQLQEASANSGQRELPVVGARKRSEFDPRSLRKLSNSEAAQALREGADYEASYDAERKLRREKARRRRSMANLGELRGELDADAQQQVVVAREEPKASAPSSFSKGFTLLRQSFRQKNFSSMLGLSNGARSATAPHMTTNDEQVESDVSLKLETNAQIKQKLEAIKMAEANLLAAKQLKQQAQRLREQQKRNEQQLQIHKQQQQQQQQLIYQQHYAQQSNRSHTQQQQLMFDPVHFHQQQQQFYQAQQFQMYQQRQQQQQQQLAYLSSSHSAAHFMAAAAAAAQPAMTLAPQLGGVGVGNHYGPAYGAPPQAMMPFVPNHHLQPPVAAQAPINHSARLAAANRYLYPQQPAAHLMGPADNMQQAHQHQFIPMSVNHHSSFNIVYTATSGAGHHSLPANYVTQQPYPTAPIPLALPVPSTMTVAQILEQPRFGLEHAIEMQQQQQQPAIRSKHSSLGASVRKTMRSVLSSGAGKSSKIVAPNTPVADAPAQSKPGKPLKSALKSSASDGSDDASPASTSSSSSPSSSSSSSPLSSSSDSSLASSGSTQNSTRPARTNSKSATLTKRELERLRKEFIVNSGGGKQTCSQTPTASELAAAAAAAQTRKNVTFSTKLTSIL